MSRLCESERRRFITQDGIGLIILPDKVKKLVELSQAVGSMSAHVVPALQNLGGLKMFESTHLCSDGFRVLVQLFHGQFSMDSLFSSSGSILYSANLNLFSPVLPPYPNGSDQVNSDWATRILSDWQYVFEFAFGIEDDQIILPNAIFGPTLST
jgi:hypothetical protein